jgi:hypothetical protein
MSRLFPVRLLLTAVQIVCTAVLMLNVFGIWPQSELPFTTERNSQGEYVIRPRHALPIPAPFRDGDVLSVLDMRPTDRAAVLVPGQNIPSGATAEVVVSRDHRLVRGRVTSTRLVAPTPEEILQNGIVNIPQLLVIFVLAMLTLWRGRDWAAWGLAAFSIGLSLINTVRWVAVPPPVNLWFSESQSAIVALWVLPALYAASEGLAQSGLSARTRTAARIAVVALALTAFGTALIGGVGAVSGLRVPLWLRSANTASQLALIAVAVLVLLIGYRRSGHESRLRIRWVLWSTAFLLVAIILGLLSQRHPFWQLIFGAAQGLSLAGYLYAVLRRRLVDISFVVDRALIFGVITAVLVGSFALLEQGLHWLAVGEGVSSVLQAATALLLAVVLNPVHRRLEHWVENLYFHREHLAVAALRRFAKECAFIERDERLLQTAVERLTPHCVAVAVYERTQSGYKLRESRGAPWPEAVDADDPLFVSLRAHRQELELRGVASVVGTEGLAVPMAVADLMTGALVCLPPPGEQFAPDVRGALVEVARNLGTSLYILRYREQARLVADIAGNRIDDMVARTRAIALLDART